MRIMVMSGIFAAFFNIGAAVAMPVDITVDRLFNICKAPTVPAAIVSGSELGWQRQTDAELEEWRTHFVAYNGGSVDVVGWRRDNAGGAESLSFWIAVGPNGHQACTFSTNKPDGLLDALLDNLGAPESIEKHDEIESQSAFWKRGAIEYSFTQVGSSAGITIGPSR